MLADACPTIGMFDSTSIRAINQTLQIFKTCNQPDASEPADASPPASASASVSEGDLDAAMRGAEDDDDAAAADAQAAEAAAEAAEFNAEVRDSMQPVVAIYCVIGGACCPGHCLLALNQAIAALRLYGVANGMLRGAQAAPSEKAEDDADDADAVDDDADAAVGKTTPLNGCALNVHTHHF